MIPDDETDKKRSEPIQFTATVIRVGFVKMKIGQSFCAK